MFALHDTVEIQSLIGGADFRDVEVEASTGTLDLPTSKEFLWQYVQSTPLAAAVSMADEEARTALEREVVREWQDYEEDGALMCEQRIVVAHARR